MSGIVGIVNLDGSPVDRELLERMTASLEFRGPDARNIRIDGNVGFGHTLLKTTFEAENELQPCTLDGSTWITADARIDDRERLVSTLTAKGQSVPDGVTDPELILHAYRIWDADCVTHLLGDFAFAIWDAGKQRLCCARDHFGIRPLYYALRKTTLAFASNLDALRLLGWPGKDLNEQAIADFLLFSHNQDEHTTIFRDVMRIPPAHLLTATAQRTVVERYWHPDVHTATRYRRRQEYVDQFREILSTAVTDRLRTDKVAIMMSGGTDSTALAALAASQRQEPGELAITAYSYTVQRLFPDHAEPAFAQMVADYLNIPIRYFAVDDYRLFQGLDNGSIRTQQPDNTPIRADWLELYRQISASETRVILSGSGGDPLLTGSARYYPRLLAKGHLLRFARDAARHLLVQGSPRGMGLRAAARRLVRSRPPTRPFPNWLEPELVEELGLRERWHDYFDKYETEDGLFGPHALVVSSLLKPSWTAFFEDENDHVFPTESRYPFLDVRLLDYVLALPHYMTLDKRVLRDAMAGLLPEPVRLRPKTLFPGDRVGVKMRELSETELDKPLFHARNSYVDHARHRQALMNLVHGERGQNAGAATTFLLTAPLCLDLWLEREYI